MPEQTTTPAAERPDLDAHPSTTAPYTALLNATPFAATNGGLHLRLALADGGVTRLSLDPWGVRHLAEILIEGLTDNLLRGNAAAPPTAPPGETVLPPSYEAVHLRGVLQARADGVRFSVQTPSGRVRRLRLSLADARRLRAFVDAAINNYAYYSCAQSDKSSDRPSVDGSAPLAGQGV